MLLLSWGLANSLSLLLAGSLVVARVQGPGSGVHQQQHQQLVADPVQRGGAHAGTGTCPYLLGHRPLTWAETESKDAVASLGSKARTCLNRLRGK